MQEGVVVGAAEKLPARAEATEGEGLQVEEQDNAATRCGRQSRWEHVMVLG